MADQIDDKKVEDPASNPADPSPANPAPTNDNPDPAAAPLNTDTGPRFDQIIKNPEFMDYFERQVERRVEAILASKTTPPEIKDEVAELEKELDAKIAEGTLTAKDIIRAQRKIAEIVSAPAQETVKKVSMQEAIAKFGEDHPDMWALKNDMLAILKGLPNQLQQYWRSQPVDVAVEHLYLKAKNRKLNTAPLQNKDLGGSPPGRSGTKLGGGTLIDQALEARRKGDKGGYERLMREHNAASQK